MEVFQAEETVCAKQRGKRANGYYGNQESNLVELKRLEMYVYGVQVMQALVKYMCSLYPVTV